MPSGVVEAEELEGAVALEGPAHVPVRAVDVGEEGSLRELLVDAHGDVPRGGDELDALLDGAVGHDHLDGLVGGFGLLDLGALALEVLLEELDAFGVVRGLFLVRGRARGLGGSHRRLGVSHASQKDALAAITIRPLRRGLGRALGHLRR